MVGNAKQRDLGMDSVVCLPDSGSKHQSRFTLVNQKIYRLTIRRYNVTYKEKIKASKPMRNMC